MNYLSLFRLLIMAQSRQLSAIMFTDIVGDTALMGEDEQKVFELLDRNRQCMEPWETLSKLFIG